jgi:hypothetical protein
VNTIAGRFAGGGESSSARKRYLRRIERETHSTNHVTFPPAPDLSFSPKDVRGVVLHDDDPLVIQVQILNCDVKRVLIDSGSSGDIMYWDAFKAMQLAGKQLQPYHGTLVGFAGEQADVMGHITLLTTFGDKENATTIKVQYLVVRTLCASYNIIIGRPAFNALGAAMSTLYLAIKYPLENRGVGTLRGDQAVARQCYESSRKIKNPPSPEEQRQMEHNSNMVEAVDLDPRENIITHKLAISPKAKPVSQRKRKQGEERRLAVSEEVAKLKKAQFIEEIKYPEWLANVVMVKKTSGKWRMCVDFTDLNKAAPKTHIRCQVLIGS